MATPWSSTISSLSYHLRNSHHPGQMRRTFLCSEEADRYHHQTDGNWSTSIPHLPPYENAKNCLLRHTSRPEPPPVTGHSSYHPTPTNNTALHLAPRSASNSACIADAPKCNNRFNKNKKNYYISLLENVAGFLCASYRPIVRIISPSPPPLPHSPSLHILRKPLLGTLLRSTLSTAAGST